MRIDFAHLRIQGVDVAIFSADAINRTDTARASLLQELTWKARASGLKIDKSALAYRRGRNTEYYGTLDLVRFLSNSGVSRWTHQISV